MGRDRMNNNDAPANAKRGQASSSAEATPSLPAGAREAARGADPYVRFTVRLAWALHRYGAPAHRLEEVMRSMVERVGLPGQFFSMPTAFIAAFGPWDNQRTFLVRIDPGDVDLQKQVLLDNLAESVAAGKVHPDEGVRRIDAIVAAPARYGPALSTLCFGVASGAAARFFGGGVHEIAVSAIVGTTVGLLSLLLGKTPQTARVFEPVASLAASVLVPLLALAIGPLTTSVAVLGGLIVLVPGLTLTTAMNELATRHLMSGTGRLLGAMTVFLVMGLGVALGSRIALLLPGAVAMHAIAAPPQWTEGVALVAGLGSFVVLFRVPLRETPWSVSAGLVVYLAARWGASALGPDLGVGIAAFLLGVLANLYARVRRRPAAIPLVPALMLLVPGSIGFRSLLSLLERNVLSGVETAFQMTMVAVSLVTGLLLANVALPPRRAL